MFLILYGDIIFVFEQLLYLSEIFFSCPQHHFLRVFCFLVGNILIYSRFLFFAGRTFLFLTQRIPWNIFLCCKHFS